MISEKLQDAINAQIAAEMWSSNIYLSMHYFFAGMGYNGFAAWMKVQADEENEHAEEFADYLMKRGGKVKLSALDAVPQEWESPLAVFEHVYNHECHVSKMIDDLHELAVTEKDKATQDFLWTFIREQVEEEAITSSVVDRIKLGGKEALYHLDLEYGARK